MVTTPGTPQVLPECLSTTFFCITAACATEGNLLLRSELQACLTVQEAAWRLASAERGTTESLTPLAEQMGDVEMVQVCNMMTRSHSCVLLPLYLALVLCWAAWLAGKSTVVLCACFLSS